MEQRFDHIQNVCEFKFTTNLGTLLYFYHRSTKPANPSAVLSVLSTEKDLAKAKNDSRVEAVNPHNFQKFH